MTEEPTVLDFVKSLLKGKLLPIPETEEPAPESVSAAPPPAALDAAEEPAAPESIPAAEAETLPEVAPAAAQVRAPLPWRALLALALGLAAQFALEPRPDRDWVWGALLYFLAAAALVWAAWQREWKARDLRDGQAHKEDFKVRTVPLLLSLPLVLLAFVTLGGNEYTSLNLLLWGLAFVSMLAAFWKGSLSPREAWDGLRARLRLPWRNRWTLLLLALLALVIFFRVYRLGDVPPQMNSDHAEKLLDVWDVLQGKFSIFFYRNTGREDFQMYLTAAVARLFGTGVSFLSLKIGTVLCGLLTLPYIYLLGKEAGGRRAGLLALVFAGIAYWPNVISRVGLRFTLYPFFLAPTLYYLVRGLRLRSRNDFLLAGIFLGLGLHGYSPFRIVPLVVLAAVGLYLLHAQSRGSRKETLWLLVTLVLISVVVFLPLLRFWLEDPEAFSMRAFSRLGTVERPLPGPALLIFLKNLWNALVMFAWNNGGVWVVSVVGRPALDLVSGALFHLGVVLVLVRYLRRRHWLDLFLLLSIPLLLLPSILSLAFPDENPILNRTAGALVPVFVIVGVALDGLLRGLSAWLGQVNGRRLGWALALLLVAWSAARNYDLVFNQYQSAYELSSWNTTEMGQTIREFGELYGSTETAWVVAYPHWVDTRLVGMSAGEPLRDFAIWPEQMDTTLADPRPKLFLLKPEDTLGFETLTAFYPQGVLSVYDSPLEGKDFWIFTVPPAEILLETP